MASAIFNQPCLSSPSSSLTLPKIARKPLIYASLSPSHISCSRTPITRSLTLGFTPFSTWNGLRRTGFSLSLQSFKLEKRKKCKGKGVYASLFGVGAPEALVIGVVALLVFGPKGLAEVAKNLGKTLRAFQPTIRELQEVSREFKTTLEKEIGLDELQNPVQGNYTSNTVRPPPDTLQNSQLTETPPAATATTEDSEATTTTPADGPEDSQETVTTSDVSPEDSQESVTTSDVSLENSQESVTASDVSAEDLRETTAGPAVTMEDSQPTVDTTNGSTSSKAYTSEDLLKITEEQLKAVASQQQEDQPSSPDSPKSEV
ncbi:putative sec-independent protein translocase protein TatA/B/E [Helianthus annuus]|nr:putative sec-independent protein translocase protein TatA/B/E [Helianthus annuus]KAJ0887927.1 putative sec-independent protein translocase protein TatA/B/E [Helianthus annuus]KAJ0892841.1 putative sec-independent protein translocase protein TatA/B/E [Helianthus annuus]